MKNDKMLVLQEKKSYNLRKSVTDISDKNVQSSVMKVALSKLEIGDILKENRVSSKKRTVTQNRSLEISITSKRVIRQRGDKKSEENLKNIHRKAPDHILPKPQENCSNGAIVFKNGKLVLPGKFGESAATNSSTLSFLNSFSNMRTGGTSNIKLNYKTNYSDIYRKIDNFEEFERSIYKNLSKPPVKNHMQRGESFFNRTAADISREARQHKEHSKYIFKNPSNVLWNQKPSIESTICQSRKYDGSSNSIFASSFKTQSNRMIESIKGNKFDISTKYGLGSSVSVFGKNKNTSLMSGMSELDRTRMINKQIILPSNTKIKSQFITRGTEDRLKLSKERSRIPYSMSNANQISHAYSHNKDPLNTHTEKMKRPDLYVFGKNDEIRHGEDDAFKVHTERLTSISCPSKKQSLYPYSENVSEFENCKDDPFQIPMERHRNILLNPLKKLGLSEFGDSVSEFGDYKYDSVSALIGRTRDTFSIPLRKQIPCQFSENTSELRNYNDHPFQIPLQKTAIGDNNSDFGVKILTERNRHAVSNLTRRQYLDPFDRCDSDFENHKDRPIKMPVGRSGTASSNPARKQMPCTFGESVSEFDDYSEFQFPTEPRDTLSNQLRPSRFSALQCNDTEFGINEDDISNIPTERPHNQFRSSNNRKTSQVVNYAHETHIRNPIKNDKKSMNHIPCSTFVEREMQSVDYYDNGTFKKPGERAIKRKVMQREELNESEYKKSRFEESRFSTASNVVSSSTKICNFYSGKGKNSQSHFNIMKSSMISPVSKFMESGELLNMASRTDNLSKGIKNSNDNNCNIKSNYFSDNDHDDTVVSSHHYIINNRSNDEQTVRNKVVGNIQKLNNLEPKDGDEIKNSKKYIICEDDSFDGKIDNDEQPVCDDDTFFFKGSYSKPPAPEETTSNKMLPDISKINSLHSASTSKQLPPNNLSNFLGSRTSRIESVNSSVASRCRILDTNGGIDTLPHTSKSGGDHHLHPTSDKSVTRMSSVTQHKYTIPKQMAPSDTFKKPALVENYLR